MVAVVPAQLEPGPLAVDEEHPLGTKNPDVDLKTPVLGHIAGAAHRADGAAGESGGDGVVEVHLGSRAGHQGISRFCPQPGEEEHHPRRM